MWIIGETPANSEGIIQGQTNTELSAIGYQQARALGKKLQNHRFTHCYSSDLKRASETVIEIMRLNKVSSSCKIQYGAMLRERIFGIAEGRSREWLKGLAKAKGIPYVNFTPDGAETTQDVRHRAITFFHDLCAELLEYRKEQSKDRDYPLLNPTGSNLSSSLSSLTSFGSIDNMKDQSVSQNAPISNNDFCLIGSTSLPTSPSNKKLSTKNNDSLIKRSLSIDSLTNRVTFSLQDQLSQTRPLSSSCSSIDSALGDLANNKSSINRHHHHPKQKTSTYSNSSLSSHSSSFHSHTKPRNSLCLSPYHSTFSDIDVLCVSHGAFIRELLKHFAYDLCWNHGEQTLQDIAPNTSVTRFQITYENSRQIKFDLIVYHDKTHLNTATAEQNLDVVNKCSL
ncbi:unnamed protein product [Didymodactylos carnosus]|uniref:Fructose-2,6-bisphosphatase n=1 Tax=Didymodactylos carnosus TaxID=1234261 RepID=A0A814MMF3_9BILA|nr:unnamed protein product [Didymodactylos carnosus]CAF1224281.1 unnamed protein product [Didymodactylos carnosus]CAF3847218.1 unnamed protein product [Didymodactylos carnosus]CAF4032457.1 unnamed protein product [Didymodactylos carnosus]